VLGLAALAGLGGLVVALGFLWFLQVAGAAPAEPARHTDGIAVLTGGAERVETGFRLLRLGLADRLLISGTYQATGLAALDRAAQADAALAGRITLGRAATTTRGNAAEVAAWARAAGLQSVRVVTAGYHMPRALVELRRTLPAVALVPHPVQPPQLWAPDAREQPRVWELLALEYMKFLAAAAGLSARLDRGPA
jgi:uncharacterized SAM-binding protein YcdF (DUF218 family)